MHARYSAERALLDPEKMLLSNLFPIFFNPYRRVVLPKLKKYKVMVYDVEMIQHTIVISKRNWHVPPIL